MKFTISRSLLAASLAKLSSVTPMKSPKEILRYIKATVKGNSLTLLATDEEISMQITLDLEESSSDGECLFSQKIGTICREVRSESITIEMVDTGKLHIQTDSGDWNLQTDDPSQFPAFPVLKSSAIVFSSKQFLRSIERTIYATDVESTRYALGGICLAKEGKTLVFAATDGRRLAVQENNADDGDVSDYKIVVPSGAMRSAQGLAEYGDTVEIRQSTHAVEFSCGKARIYSRLVEGRFPKYQDVIPDDGEFEFILVAGPFLSAVRQSMIVTNEETRGVSFVFAPGQLTLESVGADVGRSKISLPIGSEQSLTVSLDPKYVIDFLKTLEADEQLTLQAIDKSSALKMYADGTLYVLMPLTKE